MASAASPCRTSATRRRPSISERWPASCGPMPGFLPKGLVHDHERDGRSWKVEWHAVPELTMAAGKAHALLAALLEGLEVRADRMRANLEAAGGYPLSEGVMLALARRIGKQTAHRMVHRAGRPRRGSLDSLSPRPSRETRDICRLLTQEEIDGLLSR